MAGPAYFDAFRRIVVQPDNITIAADAVDDTLTLVAGAGISLVASATSDQITIVNTNTSSPSTELFAKSLTVDGIVIDTNVIRGTDSNANLELTTSGTGSIRLNSDRVTIGFDAGATSQGTFAVAVGRQAGGNTQGNYAVSVGYQAGFSSQGDNAVAIGRQSGYVGSQGASAVAVGYAAAFTNQGDKAVAIGFGSGGTDQGLSAVSIGDLAGNVTQGNYATAIGYGSGETNQGLQSVAVGSGAGNSNQNIQSVAIGNSAGSINQGQRAVAIGSLSGSINQGDYAVALGNFAGGSNQPANSIVINASGSALNGSDAGLYIDPIRNTNGGTFLNYNTVTKEIGYTYDVNIGSININTNLIQTIDSNADLELRASGTGSVLVSKLRTTEDKIALGQNSNAGAFGIGIGNNAGQTNQGQFGIAIGQVAGLSDQGYGGVAIGVGAGSSSQGSSAVAVGRGAGGASQGANAIAIGYSAGNSNQPANSIVINASGNILNGSTSGFYVDPIRNTNGGTVLNYNTTTKEISYTHDLTVGSININTNVIRSVDSNADLDLRASGTGAIQLRSNLKLVDGTSPDGAWTSYTPTWTASVTNPVLGNGTIDGRYKQVGKIVHFYINILMGSTTTFGAGDWRVSLPVTAQNNFNVIANAMYLDNTIQWYEGSAFNAFTGSTTTLTMYYTNTTVSNISPFNWASGDYLVITGAYEAS